MKKYPAVAGYLMKMEQSSYLAGLINNGPIKWFSYKQALFLVHVFVMTLLGVILAGTANRAAKGWHMTNDGL
jgi:hypothetical protein